MSVSSTGSHVVVVVVQVQVRNEHVIKSRPSMPISSLVHLCPIPHNFCKWLNIVTILPFEVEKPGSGALGIHLLPMA